MQFTFPQRFYGLFAVNVVGPAVPDHHGTATILSFRNHPLEVFIFNRMVFDFDGKMFLAALPGKSLRQRPRFQHTFHFQAEVVMQPARSMLLNDESRRTFDLFWDGLACRLAGLFEVAFAFVFDQRHSTQNKPRIGRMGTRVVEALAGAALLPKFGVCRNAVTRITLRSAAARRQGT